MQKFITCLLASLWTAESTRNTQITNNILTKELAKANTKTNPRNMMRSGMNSYDFKNFIHGVSLGTSRILEQMNPAFMLAPWKNAGFQLG